MRTLCSLDASFWPAAPVQGGSSYFPPWIIKTLLKTVIASTVEKHRCHVAAPCVAFQADVQVCLQLSQVCKAWNQIMRHNPPYNLEMVFGQKKPHDRAASYAFYDSLFGRYRGYQIIEEESDNTVLRGHDYGGPTGCHEKQYVIIKVSSVVIQHDNEKAFYNYLGVSNAEYHSVPRLRYHGPYSKDYNVLVLDALGPDLGRLQLQCRNHRFTPKMTLAVAIQTIRIYERLHEQGWLYANAKPGNFAIGPDEPGKSHKIYMFDFEYSCRIARKISRKVTRDGPDGWNLEFSSVPRQLGLPPSRRDDLEGLGYVLSYLERGETPWSNLCDSDRAVWQEKVSTPAIKLFKGMDPAYNQYFNEVKALAWGEIPDYQGMVHRFVEVWERKGYGGIPGEINWWKECKIDHASAQGTSANRGCTPFHGSAPLWGRRRESIASQGSSSLIAKPPANNSGLANALSSAKNLDAGKRDRHENLTTDALKWKMHMLLLRHDRERENEAHKMEMRKSRQDHEIAMLKSRQDHEIATLKSHQDHEMAMLKLKLSAYRDLQQRVLQQKNMQQISMKPQLQISPAP